MILVKKAALLNNILVFPCGSAIGLQYHKHLSFQGDITLFGGTSTYDHGNFVYENIIYDLPFLHEAGFLSRLNEEILRHKIDYIFPTTDETALRFSEWSTKGKISRAKVMTSPYKTCSIAYSKNAIYQNLKGVVPTPKIYSSIEDIDDFPIFMKPDIGTGGIGTHIANSRREIEFYLSLNSSLIMMEFLPGEEYTVDCLTDRKGALRYSQGRLKSRFYFGRYMGHIELADNPKFSEYAERINETLDFYGPWFCQFKDNDKGEPVLLEIATRIAASTSFQWLRGVNIPLLALNDAQDKEIVVQPNRHNIELDRTLWYWRYKIHYQFSNIYLDAADSLVLNGKLNHKLLALMIHFKHEGKKIHLLSFKNKTSRNESTFDDHLLIPKELFDSIAMLTENNQFSDAIDPVESIFISATLSNRTTIARELGIPVFDVGQFIEMFKN